MILLLNVLVFLLVLGLLVFVHELGHFLAAKACGIYCDRFSLGMPPRVWGFRWGETDYCIGALPIGGYVKMAGQEDAPRSTEERDKEYAHVPPERFYSSKPVWQRSIVIAAGPFMNLVLALVLYGVVAAVGAEVPQTKVDNRVGAVLPNSPAAEAKMYLLAAGQPADESAVEGEPDFVGWRTGDRVLSIDGNRVTSVMQDVRIEAVLGGDETHLVEIARPGPDGEPARYVSPIKPEVLGDDPHPSFGAGPFQTALIGAVLPETPAERAGLKPGDIIVEATVEEDGQKKVRPVDSGTLTELVEKWDDSKGPLELAVLRGNERLSLTLQPEVQGRLPGILFDPPLHLSDKKEDADKQPKVVHVPLQVEEESGLKPGDVVLKVDGKPATVAALEQAEEMNAGGQMTLEVQRPAIWKGLLRGESSHTVTVNVAKVGAIGVGWEQKTVFHREPLGRVVPESLHESYMALARTLETVKMLVSGSDSVQAKDIGGPLMIGQIVSQARQLGWNWLLEITAFISINLFVFNLLPLPVLDGGQLVFLAIEGVRRKPLDMRVLERVQQMGLVFIVLLILFVTFNDIQRLFTDMVP